MTTDDRCDTVHDTIHQIMMNKEDRLNRGRVEHKKTIRHFVLEADVRISQQGLVLPIFRILVIREDANLVELDGLFVVLKVTMNKLDNLLNSNARSTLKSDDVASHLLDINGD